MIFMITLHLLTSHATSTTLKTTRVLKYQTFKMPTPLSISENEIKVKNLSTFVHHLGNGNKTALRITPTYYDPKENELKEMMFNLMKQYIYATQDRMKHLDKILEKYAQDITFRASYIFCKLDQLLLDMRRVYTIAVNEKQPMRVKNNIDYYSHIAKKNVDITYIVDYMIAFHTRVMDQLNKLSQQFSYNAT